jgi:thiamine-phosphate pyrophosphorylase
MKHTVDWSLYLVTDRELAGTRPIENIVESAIRGGVSVVQLREKDCSTLEYINLAKKIKKITVSSNVPLIINDRLDVAQAVGADGVHVGQNDMPYREARCILGPDAIIGLTVETPEQAREAESLDTDYLGVSAIFATPTKTDTINEWGIEGLKALRKNSGHILIAIGGLNSQNVQQIIRAGADGIAVVSAICAAPDPDRASRELREIIDAEKHSGEKK